jgi:hypothetical protein
MHLHSLFVVELTTTVQCHECDLTARLATYDEAVFIQQTGLLGTDGIMQGPSGFIVVPHDFTLFQEA